jgi:DNA-directed RNA polymerase II subunit RPB1
LALDELGVPYKVAQGLTIPEQVTVHNMDKLRRLIENGPNQWPGAKYIIRADGRQIDLSQLKQRSDVHLEVGYIVERHLQDGDYVMFNRQPSLHKMSIMGHRVKVLPFSTFRMNLSVTTPYNADFDGDEMNMHVPQSLETLAEIREIMSVPKQILAPKENKPCMGIVQDSLLAAMLMTERDTFITKDVVMQLLMWMPEAKWHLPTPAIIKPKSLWTGKQILSMLVPNVNLQRVKGKNFCCHRDLSLVVEQGEILCGTLNKSIIGATAGGLNHIIVKDHGPVVCANFMAGVQKIVNNWLILNGFTVGVQDIIIKEKNVADGIRDILFKYKRSVDKIVNGSQLGKLKSQPGKTMKESFESQVNKKLNDARDKSGNLALDGLVSSNRLRNMVLAGSKGSNINISQIMACVGQQNVEGGRIPFGFNRRTLPHFAKDDFGPEAKGFV